MNSELQRTQNLDLLRDNLHHLRFELSRANPFWFRVGKEAYHALSRSMVEALRGSANLEITSSRRPRNRRIHYQLGDTKWNMIEKSAVPGCRLAWRFSAPLPQDPPQEPSDAGGPADDRLVGFFDLLAMIQATCFMSRLAEARPVALPDAHMRQVEWLHESIRNEFEHFIPKLYGTDLEDLKRSATIALDLSRRLLLESGTVLLLDEDADIAGILQEVQALLGRIVAGSAKSDLAP